MRMQRTPGVTLGRGLTMALLALGLTAGGCARAHWSPPPPTGLYWQYEYQGSHLTQFSYSKSSSTFGNVRVTTTTTSLSTALSEVPRDDGSANASLFWRSRIAPGRFNPHLSRHGERFYPSGQSRPVEAAVPASATEATP
jgi:hypothetical protein